MHVVEADALTIDVCALTDAPRIVIANLPYNAGTAMLVRWLHQAASFQALVLMFQHEVAERIVAPPGTAHYGRLAVLGALTVDASIAMSVSPAAFSPPPKVESAVVRLIPRSPQLSSALLTRVGTVTAAAFGQRRKMLRGSLKSLGGAALLHRVGIDPERRAETLSPAEYVRLAEAL